MTDEERAAIEAEAAQLQSEINSLISRINYIMQENARLEQELSVSINNVYVLINNCQTMDKAVYERMDWLSGVVGEAEIDIKDLLIALNELTVQYFIFKNISTASKNMTQFTDEYYTTFSYYHDLRRITLGYVIGLDAHIIGDETLRKKVEKAYLQNTDYWLAYAISAVMLWKSGEKEAAERAMSKSLSMSYFKSCLFFLLINLRFNRMEAARKWYISYLDCVDVNNLGSEWQYLLQAYLVGAFNADKAFQGQVAGCFKNMLEQVEITTVDFGKKFADKAFEFANVYIHSTEHDYFMLRRHCAQYDEMKFLLSNAEKNAHIAKYYNTLAETEADEARDLAQHIENVLYSLVNSYDDDEYKVVQKLKYNEAVVAAKGDLTAAQAKYNSMFADEKINKSLGDMFLYWAFDEDKSQTNIIVKHFAITFMKDWIAKGFSWFAEKYRQNERVKYDINIDECNLQCGEDDFEKSKPVLERHYDKSKKKDVIKDKFVLIYSALCAVALIILIIMPFAFSKIALTIAILIGVGSSFLLWRRIVDLGKILKEKKRQGVLKLKQILDEIRQWRSNYKEADAQNADLISAIEKF